MRTGRARTPRVTALATVAALASVLALLSGCFGQARPSAPRGVDEPTPQRLAPTEVREYEGRDLSSIDEFRENSIAGPQDVDRDTYLLTIDGLVGQPVALAYDDVLDRPTFEKVVTLDCVEGWSVDILWEGVLVRDVLAEAAPDPSATVVVLRAADGYSTSLPLSYLTENDILLAYRMNGVELPPERGFPFQLVAEDRWGYKWIKWITAIELSNDDTFRGYWESRGYSNSGARDESFRE